MTDSLAEQSGPRGVLRRRAAAACVDLIVVGLLAVAVGLIAGQPPANLSGGSSAAWIGLAFLYYALPEWLFGTSLGKRVTDLQVVRLDERPISLWQAVARTLLRVIDLLPVLYLLGAGSVAATKRHQRIGDLVAGTRVVAREG